MRIIKNPISGAWELAESEETLTRITLGDTPCVRNRVLLVDDEEQTRNLYATIMRQSFPSVECFQAPDGAKAVELFIQHHPLVLVMDIVMPILEGEEAFYQIEDYCQANRWQLPCVIFCTGHAPSVGLRNVVASEPAHCLLQKPMRKRILVTALSKRLKLRPADM